MIAQAHRRHIYVNQALHASAEGDASIPLGISKTIKKELWS